MGFRKAVGTLFDVKTVFDYQLRPQSFYAQLAAGAHGLFKDAYFASIYHDTRGRYSVPPSQLALLLLLQTYGECSDEEAIERSACDLRWCAVLGKTGGDPLCAKSTFQEFRARLVQVEEGEMLLRASLQEARAAGLLKGEAIEVLIDTKPILGRGAVLDTYNLIGSAIQQLVRALAREARRPVEEWAREHDLGRYLGEQGPSLKGSADLDWSNAADRKEFLAQIVLDARRMLRIANGVETTGAAGSPGAGSPEEGGLRDAYELLVRILQQDVAVTTSPAGTLEAGVSEGTAPDRIPSTTDPEQRHGRKSKSKKFVGHKLRITLSRGSRLVTSVSVLAGNAGDAETAIADVEQAEANTGMQVTETTGDCAFGGGTTRQEFAEAERVLYAKVPQAVSNGSYFPKGAFQIDLEAGTVTCPGNQTTSDFTQERKGGRIYRFGARCEGCPLRVACTDAEHGRTVHVHPHEGLLVAARAFQGTEEGKAKLRDRLEVENALARMAGLGIGQARYFGKKKTRFQGIAVATVVNLRRTWNWVTEPRASQAKAGAGSVRAASGGAEPVRDAAKPGNRVLSAGKASDRGMMGAALGEALNRICRLLSPYGEYRRRPGWRSAVVAC